MEDRMSFAPAGYTLVRSIGRGASSVVWEARGPGGEAVALKILGAPDADALRCFEREREAMSALGLHRNILTVLAADSQGGRPWLATELCRRGSLAAYVTDGGPLPVPTALRVLARLADALAAAHEAGVVHCDIKPANVLLTDHGEPVLSDFGIARLTVGRAATTTVAGFSLDHVAPELLDDGGRRSPRSDVYSLGTTVWELLDGRPPFRETDDVSVGTVLTRILRRPLPESPRIPDDVLALLRRMSAKDPDERPADMAEVRAAVETLAGERKVHLDDTPLPALTSIQLQVIEALSEQPVATGAAPTVLRVEPGAAEVAPATFVPSPPPGTGSLPEVTATFVPPTTAAPPPERVATAAGRGRRIPLVAASVVALLVVGGVGVGMRNAAAAAPEPAPVAVERTAVPPTPTVLPSSTTIVTPTPEPTATTTPEPAADERAARRPVRTRTTTVRRSATRSTVRTATPPAPAVAPAPAPRVDEPDDPAEDPPRSTRKPAPSTPRPTTPAEPTEVDPEPDPVSEPTVDVPTARSSVDEGGA